MKVDRLRDLLAYAMFNACVNVKRHHKTDLKEWLRSATLKDCRAHYRKCADVAIAVIGREKLVAASLFSKGEIKL